MYANFDGSLSEIANPENMGAACNYTALAVTDIGIGSNAPSPLPSVLQSYLIYPIIGTGNCQFQNIVSIL